MSRGAEEQPLGYLLYRVANALRTEVTANVLEPLGVAFPQYICMRVLARNPGRSNADLARDTDVSPQAMNMVLRGLESRGWVVRPPSVDSGRSLPATLTRAGTEMLERTDAGVRDAEDRLLAELTPAQQAEFRRILNVLGA